MCTVRVCVRKQRLPLLATLLTVCSVKPSLECRLSASVCPCVCVLCVYVRVYVLVCMYMSVIGVFLYREVLSVLSISCTHSAKCECFG